jgi:hypothetical protein
MKICYFVFDVHGEEIATSSAAADFVQCLLTKDIERKIDYLRFVMCPLLVPHF